ncbi:MAG: hypothetical protein PHH14_06190 [Candidatus Margulisbacteria bacterium]|nr:hypothetical protein [Candidatus Margulisiibacteriota bacterium]
MIENGIIKVCPALALISMARTIVKRDALVEQLLKTLKGSNALVLTGPDTYDWQANSEIGKTYTVRNKVIPRLQQKGQNITYLSLQGFIRMIGDIFSNLQVQGAVDFTSLEKITDLIGPNSSYNHIFIDEAHHLLPTETGQSKSEFNQIRLQLWQAIEQSILAGKKVIFITAWHPQHHFYRRCLTNQAINQYFFTAPTLELLSPYS